MSILKVVSYLYLIYYFFLSLITQENIDVYSCLKGTWSFSFIYNVYTKTDDLTCVCTQGMLMKETIVQTAM